jgi:WD40 repeat protein
MRDPVPLRFSFTSDEKTLVTTDCQATLTVWDLPAVKERHVVPKGGSAIALSPDNRTAALAQGGGVILLVDLVTGTKLARLNGLSAPVGQIAFSPDGKSLVTGSSDGALRFWCPLTGAQRLNVRAHAGPITSLALSPDGAILATGGDQTVSLWFAR